MEAILLRQVAEDNACVSSRMVAKSNRHYQDLHAAAGNAIYVLLPPVLAGTTLADRLRTMPPWIMEVATYCFRLGATSALAAAQLWPGEDLSVVDLGFPGETSYRQCQNLIGEFSIGGDGILAVVDVEDIVRNAPHEYFDCNMPLHYE
jgi:hypothetical protein